MSLYTPSEITDYSTFLNENHKRINRLLNLFLRFSILIGPVLMLLIRLGVFHSVTYTTCIVVSVLLIVLSAFHYVLTRRDGNAVPAAIVAFLAIDLMLILMNSAHIGIYMTWFVVPLISLLFCDFKIYAAAVVINYIMMAVSVWIVSPYYASLRVDFDSAFQYFAGRMGGFSIETAIMASAGYGLCRISTSHYRDLINTIHSMEEQKKKEARLIHISLTDELTDLSNRRCYDEDIAAYGTREMEDDLVVFSLDVNGLKDMQRGISCLWTRRDASHRSLNPLERFTGRAEMSLWQSHFLKNRFRYWRRSEINLKRGKDYPCQRGTPLIGSIRKRTFMAWKCWRIR